jgi:hypothetical protein
VLFVAPQATRGWSHLGTRLGEERRCTSWSDGSDPAANRVVLMGFRLGPGWSPLFSVAAEVVAAFCVLSAWTSAGSGQLGRD